MSDRGHPMKTYDLLIAGCGVSGKSAARLASFLKREFVLLDEADSPEIRDFAASLPHAPAEVLIPWKNTDPLPFRFRTAVLSPGIRVTNPLFGNIRAASDSIMGELQFAAQAAPDCPLTGITGTNGKTTTTELTTALFQAAGDRAESAGNIGAGLSDGIMAYRRGEVERLIVEISSFQLEHADSFPVDEAALLNLASDHVDRHGSMDEYARIKFILLNSAEKAAVLNSGLEGERRKFLRTDRPVVTFSAVDPHADFTLSDSGWICYENERILDFSKARLKGRHNAENMMAALALLAAEKGRDVLHDPGIVRALENFAPDRHRTECFLERNGVRYVDDSKATNPHAVNAALDLFAGSGIRILLGGLDKDMDYTEIVPHLSGVKKAYFAGQCRERVFAALNGHCPCELCGSFDEAVGKMCAEAESGDVVLLSPAAASMDEFKNYRERGEHFKQLVFSLAK